MRHLVMSSDRLTAFTDGVVAVIITIMVLEMKPPRGVGLTHLLALYPVFLSYVVSFVSVAIYWNNHHHFFHMVKQVNGALLWANMNVLFWLSLVPFATAWMGESDFAPLPTALYGVSLMMPGVAWLVMQRVIISQQGTDSALKRALGRDFKGRISMLLYVAGIALAFVNKAAAGAMYVAVTLLWLVPDRRVEKAIRREGARDD